MEVFLAAELAITIFLATQVTSIGWGGLTVVTTWFTMTVVLEMIMFTLITYCLTTGAWTETNWIYDTFLMIQSTAKLTKWHVRPAMTQISPRMLTKVFARRLLVANDTMLHHADSLDSNQTARMRKLTWVFAGRTRDLVCLFVCFTMLWYQDKSCLCGSTNLGFWVYWKYHVCQSI